MSIARHTFYNLVGGLVPLAVALVTIPLYLRVIGLERYGILSLFWLLVGYFAFFDLGLGRATAQRIAFLHDRSDEDRGRAFWTGLSLSSGLAFLAAFVAWLVGHLALEAFTLASAPIREETKNALPLLVAAVPTAILQSFFRGALEGRQRFFTVNTLTSLGAIGTGVFPLVAAAIWIPNLWLILAVSLGVRLFLLACLANAALRAVPAGKFQPAKRTDAQSMMRFGAWLTVSGVIGPLMVFADRFVIGGLMGAAAVGIYVVAFNLISQLLVLPSAMSIALFPRFAAGDTRSGFGRDALYAALFLLTPVSMIAMLLTGPFLTLWVGELTAAQATPIALVLITGFWVNGLAQLPYASLQASGLTDLTAKVHLAEILPYLMLLWIGLDQFGLVGAALVWSLRAAIDFGLLAALDRLPLIVLRRVLFYGIALVALCAVLLLFDQGDAISWPIVLLICMPVVADLFRTIPSTFAERLPKLIGALHLGTPDQP